MSRHTPLASLLDIMDRADHAEEGLSREQMMADAHALNSAHSPQAIQMAVDEHLQAQPLAKMTADPTFTFPWNRPKNEAARARRMKRWQWLKHVREENTLAYHSWIGGIVLLTALVGLGTVGLISLITPMAPPVYAMTAVFSSLFGGGLLCFKLDDLYTRHVEHLTAHTDTLDGPEEDYLIHADTRAYLRALLASELPLLMQGDAEALNGMRRAHEWDTYLEKERQADVRRQAAHAKKMTHLAGRLQRFSTALSKDNE